MMDFIPVHRVSCLIISWNYQRPAGQSQEPQSEGQSLAQALPHFLDTPNIIEKKFSLPAWAKSKSCSPIPAPAKFFASFLVLQIKFCNSSSASYTVIANVAGAHRKMGFTSLTDHPLSRQLHNIPMQKL